MYDSVKLLMPTSTRRMVEDMRQMLRDVYVACSDSENQDWHERDQAMIGRRPLESWLARGESTGSFVSSARLEYSNLW